MFGFWELFSWQVLGLNLLGVASGIIFGFLPGISATMGVAWIMPFTFGLDLQPSMSLLLGVYCGATYGGSITAILIRTPGTPAADTVLDGYPLAQKQGVMKAIYTATISSVVGGCSAAVFSYFLLVLFPRWPLSLALRSISPSGYSG